MLQKIIYSGSGYIFTITCGMFSILDLILLAGLSTNLPYKIEENLIMLPINLFKKYS